MPLKNIKVLGSIYGHMECTLCVELFHLIAEKFEGYSNIKYCNNKH